MSTYNTSSMFASIKESLNKPVDSGFKDFLKFEPGKACIVRLIPNTEDPKSTFYHYYHYSWKSFATGQFVSYVSPQTFGERCPLAEESYKIYKNGSEEEKKRSKGNLNRKENYLVNVYVVNDPVNPDNNGKIKIMRYGAQIQKIIMSAIDGDDADEFGSKIFDLSENGCNLRVKCEKKSEKSDDYVEYTASKFLSPSKIEGMDNKKIEEVLNNLHDLDAIYTIKSYDELKIALQEHYYCVDVSGKTIDKKIEKRSDKPKTSEKTKPNTVSTDEPPDDDDIPTSSISKKSEDNTSQVDSQIEDLLKGLDGN